MGDEHKHTISGPGAADFIAAPGGEDLPETSPDKGSSIAEREESHFTDARNLQPALDEEQIPRKERTIHTEEEKQPVRD